jgi:hypothetical protein
MHPCSYLFFAECPRVFLRSRRSWILDTRSHLLVQSLLLQLWGLRLREDPWSSRVKIYVLFIWKLKGKWHIKRLFNWHFFKGARNCPKVENISIYLTESILIKIKQSITYVLSNLWMIMQKIAWKHWRSEEYKKCQMKSSLKLQSNKKCHPVKIPSNHPAHFPVKENPLCKNHKLVFISNSYLFVMIQWQIPDKKIYYSFFALRWQTIKNAAVWILV